MKVVKRLATVLGLSGALALVSCATPAALSTASIPAVAQIDMNRHQGKWYEISRIPSIPTGKNWFNTSDNYYGTLTE